MQKTLCAKILKKKISEIEIKGELINMLGDVVEQMIGEKLSLDNIEQAMSVVFKKIREKSTKQILEKQDPKELKCAICGEEMKIKNKLEKKIKGLADYKIKRRSFYCKKCKRYEEPLDKIINCPGKYTLEAKKAMTMLGQRTDFEEASYFLQEILDIAISPKTVENFVETIGKKISEKEEQNIENSFDKKGYIKNYKECLPKDKKKDIAYLLMDGSLVSTREDGWKEARLGVLFSQKSLSCQTYYNNNIKRMRYGKFREMGLEIGSGAIESAHKTVIQSRMKQAGMHWSKENIQSMLSLRVMYMSGHWNEIVEDYLLAA